MRFYRQHYWRAVAIAAAASMGVTGVGLAPASAAVAGGLAPLAADAAQAVLSITSPATGTTVLAPDGQLTVTGTVAAGEEVDVTGPGGTAVTATVTAGADGEPSTWSATVAATPGAAQTFTAQAFTPAVAGGAARTASGDPMTTTVDVLAEVPAPVITSPTADQSLPAGTATTTISGSATAGASVVVTVNGTALPAVIADDQGAWSVAAAEVRPGANEVTATQAVNGATSASSAATNFTVPLEAPTITAPAGGSTHIAGGDLTVSGTAPVGATGVVLTLDSGDPLTVAATDGAWSTTLSGVEVGEHTLSATSTGANNATSAAATVGFTTIPRTETPVITAPDVSAIVAGGTVDISGTAPANSTVTLTVNGTALAPTTADGDGAWTVTGVTTVAGENTATATAAIGTNASAASAETTFTVNPAAPEITTPAAGADLPAGTANATISGKAEPLASVIVTVNGTALPAVDADGTGAWTVAAAAVQPGANEVTATQTVNGATSASSAATNFTVTVAAPVISVPAEGAALEPGDTTTISGTALPGATVSVTVNGGEAQTAPADGNGAWSLSGVAVVVGANTVSATQTINGTTSAASVTSNFTVKIAAPEIISPTAGQALIPGTTATTITGKAAPGATVNITLNAAEAVTATADETGAWSLADAAVTVGDNTLSVTQTLNGQTSVPATVAFSVAAAVQATITAPAADATVIDTDGKITVTGTNAEGQKVSVTGPEGDVVDATVTGTTWTAEVNATADKADAVVTAQATYTANNYVVPEPASIAFKVLTAVPVPTITGPTLLDAGTTTSDITGSGFPGATVNVTVNGGAEQTATVNAEGTWTLAAAAVRPGANSVSVTQSVGSDSSEAASGTFTVTVAAPVISVPAEGAALEPGDTTTISGTALPGATVSVTVNGGDAQTATAGENGAWSLSGVAVAIGANTVSATQTINGTTSVASVTSNFTVKIAAPTIATPTVEQVFDPGTTTVNITGSAVPNAAISVTLAEGADPITATAGTDGAWTVAAPATEGAHTATVTQTLNGQTSVPATVAFSVAAAVQATITAPAANAIVIAESGKITVTGTNVAGQTVKVTGPEGDIVDATVTGTTWTAQVNATADKAGAVITAQATYTSTAFAVPEPASVTVLLLTQVPAPSVDVPAAGTALDAGTTTTTITGTALPGATVNVTVNGGDAQTVTADGDGRWTLTAAAVQEGNNTVSATQTFSGQTSVAGTGDIMVTPKAPVITTPLADTELPAGTKAATISGTGLAGASVVATVDGTALDAVTVAADGTWTAEATVAAGAHTVTAVQSVGTIASAATAATAFTVALAVPVLTAPTVAQEFPAGTATVTLSGTAADGNAVMIDFADDTADLTVDVTDGAWTTDLSVVPGDYTFTVKAIIKDTTSASATLSGTFTVALADPTITTPAADGTRVLTTDGATTISGAVPEGATGVQVALDGSTTPVAATIDGATWSLALTGLAAGEHSVKVQAQGARNAVSAEVTRTFVTKAALVAPTVTTPDADGKIVWTTDGKATISGAATSGTEVAVTLDDAAAPLVAPVTDGAWSLELTGLTDASHKVSVIARDADGDVSPAAERTFTAVDRAAAPIVTTPAEGALLPAGTTTTTIAGTSQAGDIITMTAATGDKTYTATADATGAWSIADVAVVDGANSFSISADRGEGNISPSVSITVTVDTVAAPVITSPAQGEVLPGGTASADIKGTAEKAGDTVKVSVNGAEPVSVTVGENLEWVLAGATVKAGDNHVSVQATRADGVSATVERNFAVYAIAAPIVIEPTSGAELALGTTVVKFAGIATPGDTITILKDGKPVATGSVGVNFLWEIAEVPVAGGDNAFQVVASRGGVDSPPVDISVKVQTQAGTPVITSPQAGAKLDAGTTAITVTGTGTAGDTVGVNNGAGGQYSAVVAEDGTWSVEGVAVKTGLNQLAVQAVRTGSLDSPIVRLEVTVKEPAPVLYKTVTSDNLYRLTGSGAATRAVAITFEEWAEYGFPAPRAYPSAYVKYSWSNDIYAVQFWNTAPEAWTWQRLTPADWAKSNYAEPGIAGWIAGTTLHKWGTSPELFATLNGVTHKLTVNEWAAMNYANFDNRSDQGFGRVAGSSVVYKMSSVSGNRGTPITLEQWIAEGMPTPATLRSMPRP